MSLAAERGSGLEACHGAGLDPPGDEEDNGYRGLAAEPASPATAIRISDMVARKPSRPKTSRNGRLRAAGGLRNNSVGEKSGSVAERLRTRRGSTKAAGSEAAQEPPVTAIADAEPAAAEESLEATTASSKPAKQPRRATGPQGAAADRDTLREAPVPDATSVETRSPAAAAGKPRRKAAQAAAPPRPRPRATGQGSPRAGKGAEPHATARTAASAPTTPSTPAAAPAEISPELGLGLAQALSAELAGLSQRLLESSTASAQQLASARSVPELIEIQARQLKALSEAWLEHTSRMSEIYLAAVRPNARR
jgi:Phasin protein